jgi:hypothetical protein
MAIFSRTPYGEISQLLVEHQFDSIARHGRRSKPSLEIRRNPTAGSLQLRYERRISNVNCIVLYEFISLPKQEW